MLEVEEASVSSASATLLGGFSATLLYLALKPPVPPTACGTSRGELQALTLQVQKAPLLEELLEAAVLEEPRLASATPRSST